MRGSTLPAVSCTSATSCTAVGARYRRAGPRQQVREAALAEHWDGSAWTIEPTPANPPGSYVSILDAVSCTSAASCTAVGASLYVSSPTSRTLAERWNGGRWTIETTARPSGSIEDGLSGVSCTSSASCTAVGAYTKEPDTGLTLAEHWNGSTWTIQPSPTPSSPGDPAGGLNGVFCTSASRCTAVGGTGSAALAERWNGRTWTVQQTAFPPRHKVLNALSCASASTCTAVGGSGTASEPFNDRPVAEHE